MDILLHPAGFEYPHDQVPFPDDPTAEMPPAAAAACRAELRALVREALAVDSNTHAVVAGYWAERGVDVWATARAQMTELVRDVRAGVVEERKKKMAGLR